MEIYFSGAQNGGILTLTGMPSTQTNHQTVTTYRMDLEITYTKDIMNRHAEVSHLWILIHLRQLVLRSLIYQACHRIFNSSLTYLQYLCILLIMIPVCHMNCNTTNLPLLQPGMIIITLLIEYSGMLTFPDYHVNQNPLHLHCMRQNDKKPCARSELFNLSQRSSISKDFQKSASFSYCFYNSKTVRRQYP